MSSIETLDQIKKLVEDKVEESRLVEFKQDISDPHDVIKEVTAFSNADGGELIIGIIEKDSVAVGLNPIKKKGIGERIAQIIEHNTEPKLEHFKIIVIDDDNDESRAYVVVGAEKSPKAPHMDTKEHRYYVRRDKRSVPMLDNEIKALLFRRSHALSLVSEIASNKGIAQKTIRRVNELTGLKNGVRKPFLFIPLKTEAWKAFQYSGYASIVDTQILVKLVSAYNLVHEINSIIEFTNITFSNQIITTPIDNNRLDIGIYGPALIRDRLQELNGRLTDIEGLLGGSSLQKRNAENL